MNTFTSPYDTDANGEAKETRANAAKAFRLSAQTMRLTSNPNRRANGSELAAQLTAHSIKNGWLTADQLHSEVEQSLDAGQPISDLFDRLADLVDPQASTQDTTQPNTRAKVVARLREIAGALTTLLGDPDAARPFIHEAVMLEEGAAAAGFVDQDIVDAHFAARHAQAHAEAGDDVQTINRMYIVDLNWLADQIENVGEQATPQGDGATAPFTDISTEASKRAAIANELRTVRDKIKTFGDNIYDERGIAVIEDEQRPLIDKAIEHGAAKQAKVA